jgi:6-phosphogluconolactonase/glucosamine-6-phosphate isomerase/deaminase
MGKDVLIRLLSDTLKTSKVLYIVSGGSNIEIEIDILDGIDAEVTENLRIILSDERYGPSDHPESNYNQLINNGFNVKDATFVNLLGDNLSSEKTLEQYKDLYKDYKQQVDVVFGQLGIGSDGHIAGVLPASPGVSSKDVAVYYESDPYKRLTLTLETLKDIDKTIVFCFGENKKDALTKLSDGITDKDLLPSAILEELADVIVYNDQVQEVT